MSNKDVLVSVIVPNYNHARFLSQRIDSILNQTYRNFEIIILDDCSTDNSKEIIEQYRPESKISHIIFNAQNGGSTFKQWEKGITLAKTEYIWIAESDDWCEPTLLETLMNGLSGNDNCVFGYVRSLVVFDDNRVNTIIDHRLFFEYMNGRKYIETYLSHHNTIINASMVVFKKACFYRVSDRFKTFKFCGDWLFWVEIAAQGDVYISGKVLNYFRKHPGDVTTRSQLSGNGYMETISVLKILKTDSYIGLHEYKNNLFAHYIQFSKERNVFNKDIQKAIEQAFFNLDGRSFQLFLTRRLLGHRFLKVKTNIKTQIKRLFHE